MGQQIKENKEKLETATSLSAEIKTLKSENESLKSENEKDKLEKDIEFIAKLSELDEDGIADVVEKEILDKYTTDIQELENQKQMLEDAKKAMENYNTEPKEGEEAIEKTPVDFEFIKKFNEENKDWTEIETKILAIKPTDTDEVKTVYTQKDLETIDDAIKIVEKIIKPVKVQKDLEETLDRMNKALKEMEKLEKESTLTEDKVLQSQKDLGLPTKTTEDKAVPDKITEDKNDEEEKAKSDEQSKQLDPESTKLNEELTNLAKLAKEKDSSKSEAIPKIVDLTNKIKNALEKLQTLNTEEKFAEYKREMKILLALEEYIRDTAVPESNPDAGENNADLTDNAEIEKVKLQKDINALKNLKQALTPIEEKDNDVTEFKELLNLLQTIGNFEEEGTTEDEQKKEIVEQAQKKIVDLKYKYTEIPNLDPDKSFEEATKIEEETVEKKNLIQDIENELNEAQETIKKIMEKLNEETTGNIEEFTKALEKLEIKFEEDLGKLKTPITNWINKQSAKNLNTSYEFTAVSDQMKKVKGTAKKNFDDTQKEVLHKLGEDGIKARKEKYVQGN